MKRETIYTQSPGRINIIGGHTDYNDGFVLPAAIDKKSVFQLTKNSTDSTVSIYAKNKDSHFSFDLTDFKPIKIGWENYVMGVVHELQKLGAKISGFNGQFEGDVPIGGGMSSSAALECSLAFGLNELFDLGLNKWQLVNVSQMAEHNFVGIKCGIMDQFASMMGKKNQVMLLDCRSLEYQYFPFDLEDYQLLLLNTNISHTLASSEYNNRRSECEEGVSIIQAKFPEVKKLRDVSFKMLQEYQNKMPEIIYRRCLHVVSENERVLNAARTLKEKEIHALGKLVYDSHFSLQKNYEVSCPELDFLVQQTLDKNYILGSRMMGGGFGGCTINIIKKSKIDAFIEQTNSNYNNKFGIDLSPYTVSIENGTGLLIK